jgi:hypothetical protein
MRIRFEHEPREWNLDMIRESTTRSEDSVSMVRPDAQYDTTRYEPRAIQYNRPRTVRSASNRPTMQWINVRQTLHITYDPRFILYFLGEYSTLRYDTTRYKPRAIQCNTYGKPRTVRYDTIRYDAVRTASDRPTMQYMLVLQQTPHSTYNPIFVLYFLGEYSTVQYDMNSENAGC